MKRSLWLVMLATTVALFSAEVSLADVISVVIADVKHFTNGVAWPNPYDRKIGVEGTGLTSVTFTPPGGIPISMTGSGGGFGYASTGYASLESLRSALPTGVYHFSINGGQDTFSLNFNPSEPTGVAAITYPTQHQANVPLLPTFQWDSCAGYGNGLHVWLEGPAPYNTGKPSAILNITDTSWTPTQALSPSSTYTLRVPVLSLAGIANAKTDGNDPFNASQLLCVYDNRISFTTIPEPATLGLLALGAGVGLRRKHGE